MLNSSPGACGCEPLCRGTELKQKRKEEETKEIQLGMNEENLKRQVFEAQWFIA